MQTGDFKNFISKTYDTVSDLFQRVMAWFRGWVQKFSSVVLNSIRMENQKVVSFQFPPAMLSESTNYVGGAGTRMLQNIDTSTWKAFDRSTFSKKVSKNIGNIASPLGLQFEVEVVLKLIQNHNLQLVGSTLSEIQATRNRYIERIQLFLGSSLVYQEFDKYVKKQAEQLAKAIFVKTSTLLNCSPNNVFYSIRNNNNSPADLRLSCGEANMNWSLKYTSQPKITIRTLAVHEAYRLLGGKENRDGDYYSSIRALSEPDEFRDFVIDDLQSALEKSGWLDNPQNFANLLTYLLRGEEKATLAAMNYVTGKQTAGDPSSNLSKDFMVRRTKNGLILNAKPNAQLTMMRAKYGLRIKYQDETGSGTYIQIELNEKSKDGGIRLQFKVNNLL